MTLTIDLPAELESRLKAEAEAHDQTPAQWLLDLAAWELEMREAEDAEDLETLRYRRENPDPRPAGAEKMKGEENAWRVRVGDYRIIYEIHDAVLLVMVFAVGNRKEVYRKR
jgi:mRNA-degrading endonuclease RelE of RelBE toxin-antitoxin system